MIIKLIGGIIGFIISLSTVGILAPQDSESSTDHNSNYVVKVINVGSKQESQNDNFNGEINVKAYINQIGSTSDIKIALYK